MIEIGKVLRATTEGFTCGTRSTDVRYPTFGGFVQTLDVERRDDLRILGLITAIRVDDDPLVRQLIMASDVNPAAIRDQRENRMIPVEIDVLNVGYVWRQQVFHTLPPRPPMSLDTVVLCTPDQIAFFVEEDISFVRLVLNARGVPNNAELLAAAVRNAASAQPEDQRYDFLVKAGRQAANLLSHDPYTLEHVLSLIR